MIGSGVLSRLWLLLSGGLGSRTNDPGHVNLIVGCHQRVSGDSQDAIKEFQTEVDLLSKIQHPKIITLLGYCVHDETRLLVHELMENGVGYFVSGDQLD
ncbi:hypothetical protein L1987_54911 [Smallanthus sonchifolius]|uniref:Uncharacterized protein n=1 Tax=Smallanthus sonchifolius TaxID=185202 RepID=A0ACB9E8G0_9ASTR|nr:hypothetical protein L1987_54911 [Smallanthus sonchifolius]